MVAEYEEARHRHWIDMCLCWRGPAATASTSADRTTLPLRSHGIPAIERPGTGRRASTSYGEEFSRHAMALHLSRSDTHTDFLDSALATSPTCAWLEDDWRPLDWNGPANRLFTRFRDEDLQRPIIEHFR